ncbi:MAG TPA: hypothetical protein VF879_05165 [Nitrospirales bacterium]
MGRQAGAFCNDWELFGIDLHCDGDGHTRVTNFIRPILRPFVFSDIRDELARQDRGAAAGTDAIHFDSCRFEEAGEYIRSQYDRVIAKLDPAAPEVFAATDEFGKLLHPVQDFYAHSNWIELLGVTGPGSAGPSDLIDQGVGPWRTLGPLSAVQDDIIVGEIPPGGLPAGWRVEQTLESVFPLFTSAAGEISRGLVTGWNPDGACPDVRPGEIILEEQQLPECLCEDPCCPHDSQCFCEPCPFPDPEDCPPDSCDEFSGCCPTYIEHVLRTARLVHGNSPICSDRYCPSGMPTELCLNKDEEGRPGFEAAVGLAQYQTAHEWCRLLHLASESEFGYAASSILMALWAKPEDEPFGPHPISTPCGTPLGVLQGKPGPIEVTVRAVNIELLRPRPELSALFRTKFVFAAYTGDFRRSEYEVPSAFSQGSSATVPAENLPDEITMCIHSGDTLVGTIWGWDDLAIGLPSSVGELDSSDRVIRGVSLVLSGPDFAPGVHREVSGDLIVDFEVIVQQSDADADGLSACGENFYGTDPSNADTDADGLSDGEEANIVKSDPLDPDSDDDGINDGPEVNTYCTDPLDADTDDDGLDDGVELSTGTNPRDPDSDDDGLNDGDEVNVHHTNPLDADSDDDGLTDGHEVNDSHTDPLDPDTDDDGLGDGIEVSNGTNPLDTDSDDDGILDGEDVEWLQTAIDHLGASAFQKGGAGLGTGMEAILDAVERRITAGDIAGGIRDLNKLRARVDGCGTKADNNDWIVDCAAQLQVRAFIDLLIANLRT